MNLFAIALIILTSVILIVALVYIITINRTKERLALIEKGINPSEHTYYSIFPNTLKAGLFFMGGGFGFIVALLLDEYVLSGIDNPAIYPGCVLVCAGIGLVIYYLQNNR